MEGRKDAKERKRMEEEELRGQRRMKMKSKNNKKASTRSELLEEENLDGPDQHLLCKDHFSLEGGRDSYMGENSGLVEGVETMPSNYSIYEQSQDLVENVTVQYMDGTMFQGVDLAPGPVVTYLEGGGGGEKVKVAET